ncbi:hypothetical protein AMTR_s00016p00127470 [Amborella trichopoda]|uniref:TROVE domain-containing protein n=1 Tax=Amborella trichopoda TaxID=13333 RepID=W1PGH2_AMBTC|nr:hypothetical protein AMTR_s00016p00127470 [Amborella trichopoda]
MAPILLLGPPEVHLPKNPNSSNPHHETLKSGYPQNKTQNTSDPFMDLLNQYSGKVLMGRTENNSATFLTTGNPCLDFFFHIVPNTPPEKVTHLLSLAWNHDSLTTLKLIAQLQGVRGQGKSDRENFYTAALWLHQNHPKTLAKNIHFFGEFGYLKDLPEILFLLIEGHDARKLRREEHQRRKSESKKKYAFRWIFRRRRRIKIFPSRRQKTANPVKKSNRPREDRVAEALAKGRALKAKAKEEKEQKQLRHARRALERYNSDPQYRYLHDRISETFANLLASDLNHTNSGNTKSLSLAAKWCPSLDSSYDRITLICESIAKRIFPKDSDPEYKLLEERYYAYRVRDRLRKDVLVPLRKALQLPEIYMSTNRWSTLPYDRVASVAMKTYKKLFRKHDAERFESFLGEVKRGEKKIAAGALLPHEILASGEDQVAELQWRRMVEDMKKHGKLSNCLAVCDVSGSMTGTPMEVCVALGLLVSDLSEEPWKGSVVTFSCNPQIHKIEGETIFERKEFVERMEWGYNTDFQKVFDLLLKVAESGGLEREKMIKRLFVFSDMEFDQASMRNWETDYMVIERKFREGGYGKPPQIVFWNLRDSSSIPVVSGQEEVALVSGFQRIC